MKLKLLFSFLAFSSLAFSQMQQYETPFSCSHTSNMPTTKDMLNDDLLKYDVNFYYLDIAASNNSVALSGFTFIKATALEEISTFTVELHSGITVDSVLINNENVDFNHSNNLISVDLTSAIATNSIFTAQIFYDRPASLSTDGIYSLPVSGWQNVMHTLSEPYHARNWFVCKQDLHDKADSVWVFVTVDENLKAGSNGLLTQVTDLGNGKNRYEWKSKYPIAYYLISVAVANYTDYSFYAKPESLNGDSILIQNYLYKDYYGLQSQKDGIDVTKDLVTLFSDKYSLYPFWEEKYGHCYSPMYAGAMEHQTMTTTSSHLFYIIAHELGHQWFGDNVTCATWQDIWMNEGFASYSEYLAFEFLYGNEAAMDHLMNARYYATIYNNGSIYIPFEDLNDEGRIFSWNLTYRKGLYLVHMIRNEINNDDIFFSTLQSFQHNFKDSVATGDDFKNYLNEHTSVNFDHFFNEWYYGEGYPNYEIKTYQNGSSLRVIVEQNTTSSITPYFTNSLPIKLYFNGSDTIIRVKPTKQTDTIYVNIEKQINTVEFDPSYTVLSGENTISHSSGTQIEEQKVIEINTYPNPILNELFITSEDEINTVKIFNTAGKLCFSAKIKSNEIKINTKDWKPGIYFVKVFTNKGVSSERVVKN